MKERLLIFIDFLDINPAAFEKKVKLSNGFVANMGASVHQKTITKISYAYPELNINWWKTGEGSMLKNGEDEQLKAFLMKNQNNSLTISYQDFTKILKIQSDSNFFQKELSESLKTAQEQLSESQKQISTLLEFLKKK